MALSLSLSMTYLEKISEGVCVVDTLLEAIPGQSDLVPSTNHTNCNYCNTVQRGLSCRKLIFYKKEFPDSTRNNTLQKKLIYSGGSGGRFCGTSSCVTQEVTSAAG